MRYVLCLASLGIAMTLLWGVTGCNDGGDSDAGGDADDDEWIDPYDGCGEVGQRCDMSTDCPEDQVCAGHTCGCAYDRMYEIHITSAALYNRAPGGYCWDGTEPHCELPDPYAVVKIGNATHTTKTKTDTTNPIWNERFEAYIHHPNPDPTAYWVSIYDEDEDEDDLILEFPDLEAGWPIYVKQLRNGGVWVKQGSKEKQIVFEMIFAPMEDEGD